MDERAISAPVSVSNYDKQTAETVRVADSRADVDNLIDTPAHTCITISVFSHTPNFEQQL